MTDKYDIEPLPGTDKGPFTVWVYSRVSHEREYMGEYNQKQQAIEATRRLVARLGLRCLFYWDTEGYYRCGIDNSHIYGRITAPIPSDVKRFDLLPFDEMSS